MHPTFLRFSFKTIAVLFSLILFSAVTFSQTVEISSNPNTSQNIVTGNQAYFAGESIYLESEIGSANYTNASTAINRIDFSVNSVGAPTTFNNFNVYLKEVPLSTTTFSNGTYTTAGYTLVYSGSFTADVTGWIPVNFTTPFVRTMGMNLQLMVERLDGVARTGLFTYNASMGNTTEGSFAVTARRYNGSTAPVNGSTAYTLAAFRPAIRLSPVPAPGITSFTPSSGTNSTSITIHGTQLTGATAVSFGGVAAASFSVVNSTTITASVGNGASGSVTVTTPGGIASLAGFTYCPPVMITGQPQATQSVLQNDPATSLMVTATGAGLSYQWYSNTTSSNTGGMAIGGATSDNYSPSTTVGGTFYYYVVVSGSCSQEVASNVAQVTVNPVTPATALNFDGINDQLVSGSNVPITGNAPRTVEYWSVMDNAAPSFQHIFNWGNMQDGESFGLYASNRVLYFYGWNVADFNTGYTIDNQWHHYAVTYDGTDVRVYIDGNLKAIRSENLNTTSTPNYIGSRQDNTSFFQGSFDEFRIWNRALCKGEIQNNMNCQLGGSQAGLVCYYKLNQGYVNSDNSAITMAADASGNSFNSTLNNFSLTGLTSNWSIGTVSNTTCATFVVPTTLSVICPGDVTETISTLDLANPCSHTSTLAAPVYCITPAASSAWVISGATNGLGTGEISPSQLFNRGKTRVVYTIMSGSQKITCKSLVTIVDGVKPVINNAPTDFTVNPSPLTACQASVDIPYLDVYDNCGIRTMTWTLSGATTGSGSGQVGTKILNAGSTTVKYNLRDVGNNALTFSYRIIVNDNVAPTVMVTDMTDCINTITVTPPTITDCSSTTITWTMAGATRKKGKNAVGTQTFNNGVTTITYVVTDVFGNSTTQAQTINAGPGNPCANRTTQLVSRAVTSEFSNVNQLNVSLSPNPTSHSFALQAQSPSASELEVSVYNNKGQKVSEMKGRTQEIIHFGDGLQAGTYMIEVRQGEKRATIVGVKSK